MKSEFRRKPAMVSFVTVKLVYIVLFYGNLAGIANLGDTAAYADAAFIERDDFSSFAFLLSLLSSAVGGRVWLFDLLFLAFMSVMIWQVFCDPRVPNLSKSVLWFAMISPLPVLFLTVYSKELFVFLGLSTALYLNSLGSFAKFVVFVVGLSFILFAKPSFALAYVFFALHCDRRTPGTLINFICVPLALLGLIFSGNIFSQLYDDIAHHFAFGTLTYPKPVSGELGIPTWIAARAMAVDFGSFNFQPKAVFFQLSVHLMIISGFLIVLCRRGGLAVFQSSFTWVAVLMSAAPYSLFNLGSYVRYVTPLLVVTLLFLIRNEFLIKRESRFSDAALRRFVS